MSLTNSQRAEVLICALPYIQKYYDKIVVIKYGGNAMVSDSLKKAVMGDVVLLNLIGVKVVLVHGGGPEITEVLTKMNKKSVFCDGLRVTDKETAEVAQMVLAGKINKDLVGLIQNTGGNAIGLSGIDGQMITAEKIDEKLGFVGRITEINTTPIIDLLDKGYIPVISSMGFDNNNNVYNINADTAAAGIAAALKAESFISMTDISGILRDKKDLSSLIKRISVSEVPSLINSGIISDGMIPKVKCCTEAVRQGVKKVFIIDGRVPHSIIIELLTDEGIGTMFI